MAGPCGGRCAETCCTPCAWPMRGDAAAARRRRARLAFGGQRDHGGGDAGNRAHRRFGLGTNAFPGAGLGGIDIDREKHLAVVDRDRRQHIGVGQGDAARRHHLGQGIENLLLRHAQGVSPGAGLPRPTHRAIRAEKDTAVTPHQACATRARPGRQACSLAIS